MSEAHEVASQNVELQEVISDFGSFSKIVSLKAFVPFTSAENALENVNMISEGSAVPPCVTYSSQVCFLIS